jgi:mannose-6-phosphate isomerase-like protein (cupin superfamily)
MSFIDFLEMKGTKIDKPFERELKIIMSPDTDKTIKGFSLLVSILEPEGGCTDFHSHEDRGELMIFMTGYGKAWLAGKEYELKPGVAIYAPPGVEHKTLNTGKEPLQIACVFVPAISTDYILKNIEDAKIAQDNNHG